MGESKGIQKLIDFWRGPGASCTSDPYIHEDDKSALLHLRNCEAISSMETFFDNVVPDKANRGFHCSLRPVPYLGNLKKADIFILLLNPVVGYSDYGTDACPEFQKALEKNIRQDFEAGEGRCLALDTQFWWSSWFSWYERTLRRTISEYAEKTEKSYRQSLEGLADRLAIIELVPYYSSSQSSGKVTNKLVRELRSAQAAKEAARELVQRAARGEVHVVVMWGNKEWEIRDSENVVCNKARHLKSETRRRIVDFARRQMTREQIPCSGPV
jgi:hypothetical protein